MVSVSLAAASAASREARLSAPRALRRQLLGNVLGDGLLPRQRVQQVHERPVVLVLAAEVLLEQQLHVLVQLAQLLGATLVVDPRVELVGDLQPDLVLLAIGLRVRALVLDHVLVLRRVAQHHVPLPLRVPGSLLHFQPFARRLEAATRWRFKIEIVALSHIILN